MGLYLNRHGEESRLYHRSDNRLFRIDDEWYFSIRRGVDQGPYASEQAAQRALNRFVSEQLSFERQLHH